MSFNKTESEAIHYVLGTWQTEWGDPEERLRSDSSFRSYVTKIRREKFFADYKLLEQQNTQDKIESYLENTMSPEERGDFKEQLESNPFLRKELALQQEFFAEMMNSDLFKESNQDMLLTPREQKKEFFEEELLGSTPVGLPKSFPNDIHFSSENYALDLLDSENVDVHLEVKIPGQQDQRVLLQDGETLVGQHPACSLQIRDSSVSRWHLAFLWSPSQPQLLIADLGSRHGTILKSSSGITTQLKTLIKEEKERLDPKLRNWYTLQDGDKVFVGSSTILIQFVRRMKDTSQRLTVNLE